MLNVPKIEEVSYVEISDIRLDINAQKFTEGIFFFEDLVEIEDKK